MAKVLGHRGARGIWPENSIAGFRNAIDLGVDIIEFDVHLSRDGHPVVIHDVTLERTTNGRGFVRDYSAEELARFALIGGGGEGVSTLDAVLRAVAGFRVTLALEVKTGPDAAPYDGLNRKILEILQRHGVVERTMIVSFVPEVLEAFRTIAPSIATMGCVWRLPSEILGGLTAAIRRFQRIEGCILAVQEELLTCNEALCKKLIPADRLAVSVTNDPQRLEYWLAQSVVHVSTDRPDIALAIRRRQDAA